MPLARPRTVIAVMDRIARQQAMPGSSRPAALVEFAHGVSESLDGPVLRYSNRLALLRLADTLEIGRFQANLIIAAVQHRAEAGYPHPVPRKKWFSGITLAVVIEALLLISAWRMLCA